MAGEEHARAVLHPPGIIPPPPPTMPPHPQPQGRCRGGVVGHDAPCNGPVPITNHHIALLLTLAEQVPQPLTACTVGACMSSRHVIAHLTPHLPPPWPHVGCGPNPWQEDVIANLEGLLAQVGHGKGVGGTAAAARSATLLLGRRMAAGHSRGPPQPLARHRLLTMEIPCLKFYL